MELEKSINEKEDFDSTLNEEKELERPVLDNDAVVGHLQLDFVAEELSCCYEKQVLNGIFVQHSDFLWYLKRYSG